MPLVLALIATALAAASGLPGLLLDRRRATGQWIAAVLVCCGSVLGLAGAVLGVRLPPDVSLLLPFPLVSREGTAGIDALSALFLAPIFLIGGLGSVYGLAYWRQDDHPDDARKLQLFWGLLVAGMATVVLARHAFVFLLGWEVMALASFFLITTEDHVVEARAAGWIYFVSTHAGTLCLFAMFSLLRLTTGSWSLRPLGVEEASLGMLTAIFALGVVGFCLKAGMFPLHFWLPGAHAAAPGHVSALMSGVVIKMGIYGLVRLCAWLPAPPLTWGALLLASGAVSGVLGVAFAVAQHDLKRLLAYHSVENIGIILMGLGMAMAGRSLGRADWIVLGLAGCLLHVWNHALFKSLLFFSAGSVVHAAHTREIDHLGGLARPMPWTATMFLIGAVAICGLPPLNGFVSELMVYLALFRTLTSQPAWTGAALAVPALAMIGALALACFVKVYGSVFLGTPRRQNEAHESPPAMLFPMGVLAVCCVLLGLAPIAVAPIFDRAAALWSGQPAAASGQLAALAPLATVGMLGMTLLAVAWIAWNVATALLRRNGVSRAVTWDCGYARPQPRMQYTASSFAQMLVGNTLRWALRPHVHLPQVRGAFAEPTRFESHVDDIVLDRQILPAAAAVERRLAPVRRLQQGVTQHYVLYVLAAVVAMMAWTMPLREILARLFAR